MSKESLKNFKELLGRITDTINTTANDSVLDTVVEEKVTEEVKRRSDIVRKAMDKYVQSVAEYKKIGPDTVTHAYTEDGTAVKTAVFSDKAFKNKEQLGKRIAEFDIAFLKAFGKDPDESAKGYSKLVELSNQGGGQKKEE